MADITTREQIRQWFRRYLFPKQEHFFAWIESFWHKNDKIPIDSINELSDTLNDKMDKNIGEQLEHRVDDAMLQLGSMSEELRNTYTLINSGDEDTLAAAKKYADGLSGGDIVYSDFDDWITPEDNASYHVSEDFSASSIYIYGGDLTEGRGCQLFIANTSVTVTFDESLVVADGWNEAIAVGAQRVITIYRIAGVYFANCQRYGYAQSI